MKRNGKTLPALPDGHPRRLADGRNAWRKMNKAQRLEFMDFIQNGAIEFDTAEEIAEQWREPSR